MARVFRIENVEDQLGQRVRAEFPCDNGCDIAACGRARLTNYSSSTSDTRFVLVHASTNATIVLGCFNLRTRGEDIVRDVTRSKGIFKEA